MAKAQTTKRLKIGAVKGFCTGDRIIGETPYEKIERDFEKAGGRSERHI